MREFTFVTHPHGLRLTLWEEASALVFGGAFAFLLFFAIARFANRGTAETAIAIDEIHRVSLPLEPPPPPKVLQTVEKAEVDSPLTGVEISASDSPVSVSAIPPDLVTLIPAAPFIPARVNFASLHTGLRPKLDVEVDVQHVYQQNEVDQRPQPLVRATPSIPAEVQRDASSLRVVLLLLIDQNGRVAKATVQAGSGNAEFDAIVASCVTDKWLFSPAVRRGKKVRVLAQQPFRIRFSSGDSPFTLSP